MLSTVSFVPSLSNSIYVFGAFPFLWDFEMQAFLDMLILKTCALFVDTVVFGTKSGQFDMNFPLPSLTLSCKMALKTSMAKPIKMMWLMWDV